MLDQERERVAALAAAEAVEDPAVGIDLERRRLLVVEGTEALEAAAGLLERDVPADELDEVGAIADRLERLFGDPAHARRALPSGSRGRPI